MFQPEVHYLFEISATQKSQHISHFEKLNELYGLVVLLANFRLGLFNLTPGLDEESRQFNPMGDKREFLTLLDPQVLHISAIKDCSQSLCSTEEQRQRMGCLF